MISDERTLLLEEELLLVRHSGEIPEVALHASVHYLTEDPEGPGLVLADEELRPLQEAALARYREIILRDLDAGNRDLSLFAASAGRSATGSVTSASARGLAVRSTVPAAGGGGAARLPATRGGRGAQRDAIALGQLRDRGVAHLCPHPRTRCRRPAAGLGQPVRSTFLIRRHGR